MGERPLYQSLTELYKRKILSGELQPGDRMLSEKELMRLHSISNITARRILNDLSGEGYAVRIKGRGTFVAALEALPADPAAKAVRMVSLILVYDNEKTKSMDIIGRLSTALGQEGYYLCVHASNGDEALETQFIENSVKDGVEGILIYSSGGMSSTRTLIERGVSGFPIVMLDRRFDGYPLPSVTSDNVGGSRSITRYLIAKGHRRIAYVANRRLDATSSVRERYRGYAEAMLEAGLPVEELSLYTIGDADVEGYWRGEANERIDELLRGMGGSRPITALACLNDPVAIAMMGILQNEGIAVPERVSIVGFDNLAAAETAPVPLTTVHQDYRAMAGIALELLLDRMRGKTIEEVHRVVETRIVERASVAEIGERG